jgi:hypothetical protein
MEITDISDFCKTKAQATDFSTRLGHIEQQVYHTDFTLEKALLTQFGLQKKDKFITLLRNNSIPSEGGVLKEFLVKLQTLTATLPVLSLTVAFEPGEQTLKLLSDWFLLNVKKQVLFDITVDPTLIAGVSINFNGKHAEFSIKPQFAEILKQVIITSAQPPQAPPHPIKPMLPHQSIEHISLGR